MSTFPDLLLVILFWLMQSRVCRCVEEDEQYDEMSAIS